MPEIAVKQINELNEEETRAFSTLFKFSKTAGHKYNQNLKQLLSPGNNEVTLVAIDVEGKEPLGFVNYEIKSGGKKVVQNDIRVWRISKREKGTGNMLRKAMIRDAIIAETKELETKPQKQPVRAYEKLYGETEFFLKEDDIKERQLYWRRALKNWRR